jgi:Helix-turn-helix domain
LADEFKATHAAHIVEAMARGLTVQAAAAELGYCRDTIYAWAKDHPEMQRALKIGKAKRVLFFENLNITISSTGIGNIAGVIFALKNADPEEWRDGMPPPPAQQDAQGAIDLLMLAQKLAHILERGSNVLAAQRASKLIEGTARPNGAAVKNGHG